MDYLRNFMFLFLVILSLVGQIYCKYSRTYRGYRGSYSSYYYSSGGGSWIVGVAIGCTFAGIFLIVGIIFIVCCCMKHKNKKGHVVSPVKPETNGTIPPTGYTYPPAYTSTPAYTSAYAGQEMNPPPPPTYYAPQSGTAYPPSQDPAYPPPQDPA